MVDFKYLYMGICGLAHAHRVGTMAGHLGAAVATGYFFGEDQSELPDGVFRGIEAELDRVIGGEEAIWFDVKKTGVTPTDLFKPFAQEPSKPESIKSIAAALQNNVGTLKQSGHNVIFASIAIRALHGHDEYATPAVVSGIRKLIEGFDNVSPGRGNFGKEKGWRNGQQIKLVDDENFPKYDSIQQMVDVTIDELIATSAIKKQGFGSLWHIINHAAGITELERLGYRAVANLALPAHHHHIRLWRTLPDLENELGPVVTATHHPLGSEYWQGDLKRDSALLTHRIKTMYGYYTIRRFVEDLTKKESADEAFLNLMG